jgi:hypothetical protein
MKFIVIALLSLGFIVETSVVGPLISLLTLFLLGILYVKIRIFIWCVRLLFN